MDNDISYVVVKPPVALDSFVESFWRLTNESPHQKEITVLPDGRIDLILSQSAIEPFHIMLSGLETCPEPAVLPAQTTMCAISFKLPAIEFIFQSSISNLLNYAARLPTDFWSFTEIHLQDFDSFCQKASQQIASLLPAEMDSRKRNLFDRLYTSQGVITVKELSEKVYWSSRQINRYFNEQYGISLKTYCSILRFSTSLKHLAKGLRFAEPGFADQSHFIKEVKRFSGVSPKELKQNKNDRFIQFSVLRSN